MQGRINLSPTSSLVLLWTDVDTYPSQASRTYLEQLDLQSGYALYAACRAIWPAYHEVIKNRKHCIWQLLTETVTHYGNAPQIVIAGAGLAPLSIECKMTWPQAPVFDIDRDNMALKQRLIAQLGVSSLEEIHCISADLQDVDRLRFCLRQQGWDPQRPTVLVLEGISYYTIP